jgi:hypothetical protein
MLAKALKTGILARRVKKIAMGNISFRDGARIGRVKIPALSRQNAAGQGRGHPVGEC